MNWLFKEEPANYSYDDLARDGRTSWTGVRNPLAQKHLRAVGKGDRIFFYHTGDEKAVIGIAKARKITTTAEGVETDEQRRVLRKLGCDEMQGFLISRAKPAAEIRTLWSDVAVRATARA